MINVNLAKANKVNGEWALYVSFPYDGEIVDVIKSFPSRYYYADKKEWEIPFKCLESLVNRLSSKEFTITGNYIPLGDKKAVIPADFQFKTKPFTHQYQGFEYGLKNDKWLLGDEMGLGKTKQAIDIAVAKKLAKGYKHCLIICGVNGLKWNWVNEIATHSNEGSYILGQRVRNGKVTVGSNADKLADLQRIDDLPYFIITNIESIREQDIVREITNLTGSHRINMVVADEVHKMKNPSSQQGKNFLKINAETLIAMTGTPLMNNPLDLYIILKWLGYEKHSFYAFRNYYCEFGGYGGYEVMGYKHLNELQAQLDEIMLRRRKNDVLDLPAKIHIDEYVEMTPKQAQIYAEVTAAIKANIDQIKMANNPLAELIRMRQATGYTGILSSTIAESAKLDRMEELVEEAVENGKKVVIFSNWTQMTDVVVDRLHIKGYYPAIITGQVSDAFRQEQVEKFQHNDRCKVIVGTTGAMGTGITLTAGTVEIFLDEPWNRANKEQAEDRCHRVGTTESITIYTLLCKDTIDCKIHDLVEQKGMMSDVIVDGMNKVDSSKLLDYFLS